MKYKNILILMSLFLWMGCAKQEIPTFGTDDAGIYFQRVSSYIYGSTVEYYTDSVSYSFASVRPEYKEIVLNATVRTMGKVKYYDRPFKVVVDKNESTAIEGTHFTVNLDTLVIPAGKSEAIVPVTFYRTADLLKERIRLVLRLEENEHFKCYFPEYKNTNSYLEEGNMVHGIQYVFSVSEKYTQPSYWGNYGTDYFGVWSIQKYLLINQLFGLTVSDWSNGGISGTKVQSGRFSFWATQLQKHLQEQADAGTPVLDDDGSYMQLPSGYEVDYTRYQ